MASSRVKSETMSFDLPNVAKKNGIGWDEYALWYHEVTVKSDFYKPIRAELENKIAYIHEILGNGLVYVDGGPGIGHNLPVYLENGASMIFAIDKSPGMLAETIKTIVSMNVVGCGIFLSLVDFSMGKMPLESNSVNVWAETLTSCYLTREQRIKHYEEISRILKKGGFAQFIHLGKFFSMLKAIEDDMAVEKRPTTALERFGKEFLLDLDARRKSGEVQYPDDQETKDDLAAADLVIEDSRELGGIAKNVFSYLVRKVA